MTGLCPLNFRIEVSALTFEGCICKVEILAFTGILTESTVLLWMWLASCLNPFGQSDQCDKTFTHYTRIVIKGQQN